MEIIKPSKDRDVLLVKNILTGNDLRVIQDHAYSELYYGHTSRDVQAMLPGKPPENQWSDLNQIALPILDKTEMIARKIMREEYPDIKFNKYWNYGGYSLRTYGHEMAPHTDADLALKLKEISSILYINEEFGGGEIYYPEIDFSYKPEAGSLVMHRVEHMHGVKKVLEGWRITYGFFGSQV